MAQNVLAPQVLAGEDFCYRTTLSHGKELSNHFLLFFFFYYRLFKKNYHLRSNLKAITFYWNFIPSPAKASHDWPS